MAKIEFRGTMFKVGDIVQINFSFSGKLIYLDYDIVIMDRGTIQVKLGFEDIAHIRHI